MNAHSTHLASLALATGLAALALGGCSKGGRKEATAVVKDAYADTKAAVANAWDDVKSYSFDKRDDFAKNAKALTSKFESEMSQLRANYSEAKASASRKLAMAELKSSEIDYQAKLDALGHATAATWERAKQNVIASWDRLQAAYQKARAD